MIGALSLTSDIWVREGYDPSPNLSHNEEGSQIGVLGRVKDTNELRAVKPLQGDWIVCQSERVKSIYYSYD